MSKKVKSLKKLSDKDLSKLVGGLKVSNAGAAAANGSTWLYNCWEGVCTNAMKAEALRKATPAEKAMLAQPVKANLKSE